MRLRNWLGLVIRRWPTIVILVVLSIAVAAVLTARSTSQYESHAQLFASPTQSDSGQSEQSAALSVKRAASYAHLIEGNEMARRAINALDLHMTPAELSSHTRAHVVKGTLVIELSVRDPSAKQAQAIANELAHDLVSYVTNLEQPVRGATAPVKIAVVDAATLPTSPVSPHTALNLGVAAIIGIVLGLLAATVRGPADKSVTSKEDLDDVVKTPVLGAVNFDKEVPKAPLITSLGSHHPRAEAMRILRTNLQFADIDRGNKVIAVTSSVPGEGKTTISVNLAIAMAQAGRQVLLLEGDLRRPRVGSYLNMEDSVGLTTVLIGLIDLEKAIQPSAVPNLDVLTSGAKPPNPAEVIQTGAMSDLMDTLRDSYDVIIVDSPPLLPVTDAALLTTICDGVIVVVRHGKTSQDEVRNAVGRIESVGGRLLGAVLNMTPARSGFGRYGYGYGYEYEEKPAKAKEPARERPKAKAGRRAR